MSTEDEQALEEDIARYGIVHPLDVTATNQILDGVHRWHIAQRLALTHVPIQVFTYQEPEEETLHAFRANLKRRHLSSSQKAMLALEVEQVFAQQATKRVGGRPKKGAEKLLQNMGAVSGYASDRAASLVGTNGQYVLDAKKIVALAPDLKDAVLQGVVTLPQAKVLATHPHTERTAILTSIAAGERHAQSRLTEVAPSSAYRYLSESTEWYTPVQYITAVRELMGAIDLDPASTAFANQVIRATHYYDKVTDGLSKPWTGRVFLNPPYGQGNGESNQGVWSQRLIEQYTRGMTTEAVLLVNAVTERNWFQPLWDYPICFTNHRIAFYNDKLTPPAPTHGNAFVYFGRQEKRFLSLFSTFGTGVKRVTPSC